VGVEFYKAELLLNHGIHTTLQASCTAVCSACGIKQQQWQTGTLNCCMVFLLQVWDIASSLSSLTMAANYLHGCHAVLCVHDITQEQASSRVPAG
jgi:hypothetical protein